MVGIFVRPHSHHRRDAREIRTSNGAAAFLLLRKPWENNNNKLEMVKEGKEMMSFSSVVEEVGRNLQTYQIVVLV